MKRRIIAALMALCLCIGLLPATALAADGPEIAGDDAYTGIGTIRFTISLQEMYKLLLLNAEETHDSEELPEITGIAMELREKHYVVGYELAFSPIGELGNETDYFYALESNADGKLEPDNFEKLIISYRLNGETKSAEIPADELRLVYDNYPASAECAIESRNDGQHIVLFFKNYTVPGASGNFLLHAVRLAEDGKSVSTMPPVPTHTTGTFSNWSTEKIEGENFNAHSPVHEDMSVYEQFTTSERSGTVIRVMNEQEALLNRYVELYNASHEEKISSDQIHLDTVKITVNGVNEDGVEYSTDPDYSDGVLVQNGWKDEYSYYYVNNYVSELGGSLHNTHMAMEDIRSITVSAVIGDDQDPTSITIEQGDTSGNFSITLGSLVGGVGSDAVWEFTINAPPTAPDDEDLTGDPDDPDDPNDTGLLGDGAVTVDCTSETADHADKTYGLKDGYTIGDVEWRGTGDAAAYYVDITNIAPDAYVTAYNTTIEDGHALSPADQGAKTITLKWADGEWKVSSETPVFTVTCDDKDDPDPGVETLNIDVYVYLRVEGSGQNGELTDEDLATIAEWKLEKSNPDDYYILGKLSGVGLPEDILTDGELTYEKYATYIKQAFTDDKFTAYKGNSVIDEDFLNGIAWENLVWASGAPGYESETQEGNCLHLDGVLKLEEPGEQGLSVTKSVKLLEDDVPKEIPFEGVDVNDTLQYTVTVTNNGDATEPYAVVIYDSFFESDAVAVNPVGVADVTTASATITSALNNGDSVTFTYTHIVTEQDQNEGQVFNAASVRLNNEVKDEATVTVPVKAKTYDLIYNANGGTFADTQGTFVVEDLASGTEYTLGSEGNYRVPTHADGSLDGKTVGVEFVGWTLSNNQGFIYRAGATNVPDLRDKVTIQSPGVTVYAVWGYDENGDGVADINQIVVKPADITIYMGGTGYEGTVDANGNTITSTAGAGLPEPGFIVTLPSGAPANTVITNLVFKEADGDRTWRFETYDGREDTVVYKLVPQGDEQTATRVQFTKANGEVIVSDEFTVGLEVNTSFTMALYKGSGATAVGKIVAEIDGKSYSVNSDPTGTLTVRGTTDDAQYAGMTAEETRSLPEEGKPAVMAPRGTTYAINGGDVQVADTDGVALLFDAVIDHADENRTELLQNRAEAYFADGDVEPETGNKFAYEFKYLDLVDQNNGNVWVAAQDADGKGRDVTVYWPLPEGTNADTNFTLLHFKGLHREMATGDIATEIGKCAVEEIQTEVVGSHVTFKIGSSGFSPFALVYEKDGTTPPVTQYTVTYDANGGRGTMASQTVNAGDSVTIRSNAFTRSNYAFDGWNTRADGRGTSYGPGDSLTVNGNITLYAQWDYTGGGDYNPKDATLRFNSRGGTEFDDIVRDDPFEYNPYNKIPSRPGYRFTGWYNNSSLDRRYPEDEKISVPKGITTVWAGWEETSVPSMLNGDDHYAYIQGYSDGTVRPNANITRAQVATIFFRLLDEDVRDDNLTTYNTFPDVDEDYWANTAISTMASLGVVNGRNSGLFDPDAYITRAEFAAICARFDDSGVDGITTFTDTVGHWAEDEISRAAALGWIQGYSDGTFRPNQYITRAQAVTMINRVLCRLPEDTDDLLSGMNTWTDCHEDDWFYLAIQEATNSHDFVAKDRVYESWTDLNRAPDWSRYE